MPILYGPKAGSAVVLPGPHNLVGGLSFKQNDTSIVIPGARFGDNICDPTQWMGS